MISYVKSLVSCEEVREHNPMCERNLKVSFSHMPPYVHQKENEIVGILPGIQSTNLFFLQSCVLF